MKLRYLKTAKFCIAIITAAVSLVACSKMDSTYVGFIDKGSITYVGTPDSLKVHPGKNRIKLSWILSDPTTTKAKLYWNNRNDSLRVDIPASSDTINVWLNDLREGSYSFELIMYDKNNNRSVTTHAIAKVYGDNYINTLIARPVKSAIFRNDSVTVTWGAVDSAVIATVLTYTDKSGRAQVKRVPVKELMSTIYNYSLPGHETFQYRTLYVPDSLSVDSFYSVPQTVKITGPAIEYARTKWTALSDDFDGNRLPKNLLDNDVKSIWHMNKTSAYPHTLVMDMGAENLVYGFSYVQRTPLDGAAKLVEIQVSSDNLRWRSLGAYTFENIGTKQFLELLEPATFRYFKMIFRSDYKNGGFTALAELGAYKR